MSQEIIKVVPTPNPDAYMFRVNETLVPTGTYEFERGENSANSPLAERLLKISGVDLILIAPRFITIRKLSHFEWFPLASTLSAEIVKFLNSGEMAVYDEKKEDGVTPESEIEKRILDLLDEEIRPAIAQDGGDVVYHGFEDGIVKLELIGACGTCPSSTATLQYGIQNLLMEEIPEVEGVEQFQSNGG